MKEFTMFAGSKFPSFAGFYTDSAQFSGMRDCRIPSLLTLKNGRVIAAADKASCGADWGRIETVVRISDNGGESFSPLKTVLSVPVRKYPYSADEYSCAFVIDPQMCENEDGKVIMLVDFYPECKGLHAPELLEKASAYIFSAGEWQMQLFTVGADKNTNGKCFTLHGDGFVYTPDGVKTRYYIPKKHSPEYAYGTLGDMYFCAGEQPQYLECYPPLFPENKPGQDIYVGNIYLGGEKPQFSAVAPKGVTKRRLFDADGSLLCAETAAAPLTAVVTSYIFMLESSDGGESFSQPVDITPYIKDSYDGDFLGVGPGLSLCLKYSEKKGRILSPVYILGKAAVIISDDGGKSWRRGKERFCENIDECQLIETPDGRVFCIGRPLDGGNIPLSVSEDAGESFKSLAPSPLSVAKCMKSAISLPETMALPDGLKNDGFYILMSTPTGHGGKDFSRTDGTVFLGHIEGKRICWLKSYAVKDSKKYASFAVYDDFFAYSCLTVLPSGKIGLLYEAYPSGLIMLAEFSL